MAITQGASGKYYCKIPGKPAKICIQDGQPTGATCNPLPPEGEQSCSYAGRHGVVVSGNSRSKNLIFDYVVKYTTPEGSTSFFGAIVTGDEEKLLPIDGDTFASLTGRQAVTSLPGVFRFYKPKLKGLALRSHINQIVSDRGYGREAMVNALRLLPLMETALMILESKNVPIADRNDPFEVFTKYIKYSGTYSHIISDGDYQALTRSMHQGNNFDLTSIFGGAAGSGNSGGSSGSGSGGFDFGGMIGGLLGMFGELFQAGQSAATSQELGQWIQAYKNYMQVDFGDIARELREHGAQAALDWLLRLKRTSWNDLKQYNIAWCQSHGVAVPSEVIQIQQAQADLESELKQMVNSGTGTQTRPNGNQAPYSPQGGSGSTGGFPFMTVVIVIGAVLAVKMFMK